MSAVFLFCGMRKVQGHKGLNLYQFVVDLCLLPAPVKGAGRNFNLTSIICTLILQQSGKIKHVWLPGWFNQSNAEVLADNN